MMILLRAAVLVVTTILAATGLVLAVLALLAAQWLLVAGLMLIVMALIWAARKGIARIGAGPTTVGGGSP
jgi:hypothetical protein